MKKYTAQQVADYFLHKAQKEDQELLSNLKLQKLIYYAQGLHLAMFNEPLFDEIIEAWTYGPVIPALYHFYKEYGSRGIPADERFDPLSIDEDTREFLDEIYSAFGQFSAIRLMEIAHSDKCWIDASEYNRTITFEAMKEDLKKYLHDG